jgi:hypothetical protein
MSDFSELLGKTLTTCRQGDPGERVMLHAYGQSHSFLVRGDLLFSCDDGTEYVLYHEQDCCEFVEIESIDGDLSDLIGEPLLMAEVSTSDDDPEPGEKREQYDDCRKWTFYRLATVRGYVTVRWFGASNGYYSVDVSFDKCTIRGDK